VSALVSAWDRFWFAPQSTATLALLRIVFGVVTVVWALVLVPDIDAFFEPDGLAGGYSAAPLVVAAMAAAAVCVTIGLWTRVACGTVLFCIIWLHRVDPLVWNTGDVLLRHVALFLTLSPAGDALSVDRWRRDPDLLWEFPQRAPWALRLVQVQVALMYLVTVVAKLHGWTWRQGTAVSYVMRIPEDARFALPTTISASTFWAHVLTWGTLAVEASIPLLVWNRRLRPYVLAAGVGLHLAIDVTMRVGLFSWIVLLTYLAFVPPATAERVLARFHRRRAVQAL
jgi:hypothetical protein